MAGSLPFWVWRMAGRNEHKSYTRKAPSRYNEPRRSRAIGHKFRHRATEGGARNAEWVEGSKGLRSIFGASKAPSDAYIYLYFDPYVAKRRKGPYPRGRQEQRDASRSYEKGGSATARDSSAGPSVEMSAAGRRSPSLTLGEKRAAFLRH